MGLVGKHNWKTMPKVMRQWRAISAAFRPVFADVLAGLYTPEEMGAAVDEEGAIVTEDTTISDLPSWATDEKGEADTHEDILPELPGLPPP